MLTLEQVMNKSIKRINGLHYIVASATEQLITSCYKKGILIVITQGLRTIAEQNALYAQGRTTPGQIVTNAKGGTSFHNYGLAIDFALLLPNGSSVSWDMNKDYNSNNIKDWIEVVEEAKKLGFEWGGDWTSFKDYPHFQITFGLSISDCRNGKAPAQSLLDATLAIVNKNKNNHKVVEEIMKTFSKYFCDVDKQWSAASIDRMKEKGIFAVPDDKKFNPSGTLTRQELAVTLDRLVSKILDGSLK